MKGHYRAACALVFVALSSPGQAPDRIRFEVASVKLADGKTPFSGASGGPGSSSPENIRYSPVALRSLICSALSVQRDEVSGPAWIDSLSYVVSAKLPPHSTKEDLSIMTLRLLEDRFGFTFHRESRNLERLELRVDGSGSKLGAPVSNALADGNEVMARNGTGPREKDAGGFPVLGAGPAWAQQRGEDGLMRLTCKACSMRFFGSMPAAILLSRQQGRSGLDATKGRQIVYDQTDLPGSYDFHLLYAPVSAAPAGAEPSSAPGEDLNMALRHQLGLRVVNVKTPIPIIVVDHLNRIPTEN